jgi:succinate dehydrogenase / fumarate reductase flavoprotein subunit
MHKKEVIVVGGGLAGLSAAMKLADKGLFVKLVSLTKVRRSHSVCAQGGINVAINSKDEGDSPLIHAYDTIKGGDFLADQPPIVEMCLAGPAILRMLDRFGCPFNRTEEGKIQFRRFGGTLFDRTAFCGASTGQQLLYSLDEQVRRHEVKGNIQKYEYVEFLRLIQDSQGRSCGIVVQDLVSMELSTLTASAVVIATGGIGFIYRKSTNSTFCTGAANGRLYLQGMQYANGEFVQIHPTAIPGEDKMRLMSESLRGEGGRIWVFGNPSKTILFPDGTVHPCGQKGEPWYFLEAMYPIFGNLVPRDIAAREILHVCEEGLGIDGKSEVYLDVSHLPEETLKRLEAVLDIYEKFTGENPRQKPMRIFPAFHYTMGGAWVDWPAADDPDRFTRYRQMTNLKGCFNIGESDYSYHGANRLGANSLLSCIFSGLVAGVEVARYVDAESIDVDPTKLKEALQQEKEARRIILESRGSENVHRLHEEMADWMVRYVSVKRDNAHLQKTLVKLEEIKERFQHIQLDDRGLHLNQTLTFAMQLLPMLELARVITKGALLRNEFRGAHYKPEFPTRDDANWLKTTMATWNAKTQSPDISYKPVDTRHFKPVQRDYTHAKKGAPLIENLPDRIELPL